MIGISLCCLATANPMKANEDEQDLDAVEEQLLAPRRLVAYRERPLGGGLIVIGDNGTSGGCAGMESSRHGWSLRTRRELKIVSMSWL